MTFAELFEKFDVPGDPRATAKTVIEELCLTDDQEEALAELIVQECCRLDRGRTRGVERRIGWPATSVKDRRALAEMTFTIGDGIRIPYLTATVAQHRARIAFLAKQRDGIERTIGFHRKVVDACVAAGVDCIQALPLDVQEPLLEEAPDSPPVDGPS